MAAIVDFAQSREPLVVAIERAITGGDTVPLRQHLASLPGSTMRQADQSPEKLEIGVEAKALLELAFRTCMDRRVVWTRFFLLLLFV